MNDLSIIASWQITRHHKPVMVFVAHQVNAPVEQAYQLRFLVELSNFHPVSYVGGEIDIIRNIRI